MSRRTDLENILFSAEHAINFFKQEFAERPESHNLKRGIQELDDAIDDLRDIINHLPYPKE